MLMSPRLHKGLFAVKEATMPYIHSAVHAFEPSYTKHPKQSFTGGIYQPLADESMTDTPSYFKARHRAELYTRKTTLHTKPARRSIYIPTTEASPVTCDTNILAIADEQHASSFAAEEQVNGNHALQAMPCTLQTVRTALTTAEHGLKRAGHVIASAARTTACAARTAATTVRNAWHTFTSLKAVQLIIKFFQGAHALWKKRHRFSYSFYFIIIVALTTYEIALTQWGTYTKPKYPKGAEIDALTYVSQSVMGQTVNFFSKIFLNNQYQALLNLIVLSFIYLTIVLIINRFWIATAIFGTVMTVFAIANHIKILTRNEPIIPADLNFVSGGTTKQLFSFIPKSCESLVNNAVTGVTWLIVICIIMQFVDGRNAIIPCHWWKPFRSVKSMATTAVRILAAVLSVAVVYSFTAGIRNEQSWAYQLTHNLSDYPVMWNAKTDAQYNGPAINFLRLSNTKVMNKPKDYSKKTMEELASKYAKNAVSINQSRSANMTSSTVIMILSESFSDPTRVPGITMTEDPMPNIRQLKEQTTSGLMLSPGYGGGTANIEYQALSGLSMANFDSSLSIAYQQLVPNEKWTPTLNQLWNDAHGKQASVAYHDYYRSMYFRNTNYKKFGFNKFWTVDGSHKLKGLTYIDRDWTASDESLYNYILNDVQQTDKNQFLQVVTMQNHTPYNDWYDNNQFKDADISQNLSETGKTNIDTYAKGASYTDQSTLAFLHSLNEIDRPITVVFYGDHLPGIYDTASASKKNSLALHETDYFIWSNNASQSAGTKLDSISSAYTSSNYFSAQLAQHLNAKVSPYIAFLTKMHQAIPAMSVPSSSGSNSKPTYLDANGNLIKEKNLSKQAKQLLHDYHLIQYDMTSGKHYLKDTGFVDLPK